MLDASNWLLPWVLFAEASALFAHVFHGRRDEVTWLLQRSRLLEEGATAAAGIRLDGAQRAAEQVAALAGTTTP